MQNLVNIASADIAISCCCSGVDSLNRFPTIEAAVSGRIAEGEELLEKAHRDQSLQKGRVLQLEFLDSKN